MPHLPQAEPCDESVVVDLCTQYKARLERTRNILCPALESKHAIDFKKLICDWQAAKSAPPNFLKCPSKPQAKEPTIQNYAEYPPEPQRTDVKYQSSDNPIDREYAFVRDYQAWAETVKRIEAGNQRLYDENVAAIERVDPSTNRRWLNGKRLLIKSKLKTAGDRTNPLSLL